MNTEKKTKKLKKWRKIRFLRKTTRFDRTSFFTALDTLCIEYPFPKAY